jgi:four helix bundle protein
MGEIRRFEDLIAWQLARELTREGAFSRDFALIEQLRRAAISIMSNIAEGFERDSEPDRLRFYSIAKASCAELRSQLYIALDAGYLDQAKLNALMSKSTEVGLVIGGLRTAINRNLRTTNGKK